VLSTDLGTPFKPLNFDAYSDIIALPAGNLVGIENLTMTSQNDSSPFFELSVMITVATENDVNNMLLSKALNYLFSKLQPTHTFMLYDESSGAAIGKATIFGRVNILPVNNTSGNTKTFQSINFEAAFTV
jgi:hypothetical protein